MKIGYFDVAILGRGLGGIIAASLLQRRGLKVLILDHKQHSEFDPALCEFLNGAMIKPVLQRIGFHPAEIGQLLALDTTSQLIYPNRRINCYKNLEDLRKEVERECNDPFLLHFFAEKEKAGNFYLDLFYRKFQIPKFKWFRKRWIKNNLSKDYNVDSFEPVPIDVALKKYHIRQDYKILIRALEIGLNSFTTQWTTYSRFSHLLYQIQENGFFTPFGVYGFKKILMDKFLARGGEYHTFDEIKDVKMKGNQLQGFSLNNSRWDEIILRNAIISGDVSGFTTYFAGNKQIQKLQSKSDVPVVGKKAYFLFKIKKILLPYGLKNQGFLFTKDVEYTLYDRRRIPRLIKYVMHIPKEGQVLPPAFKDVQLDEAVLAVTAFLTHDHTQDENVVRHETIEKLKALIPFATHENIHCIQSFVPQDQRAQGDFREGLIYSENRPSDFGMSGNQLLRNFSNLYVINDSTYPSLGLDGLILSADQISHTI
jgi:hypothetical protein